MDQTGIRVKTRFFPRLWFFFFCSPVVEIGRQIHKTRWGRTFYAVPLGKYVVKVYFRFLGMPQCGVSQIEVDVQEGRSVFVDYYMSRRILAPGKMEAF
jgi:hypothetical protein